MSNVLRIALAWLLAVALPLQGYAAQAMLLCGPAHHPSVAIHDHAAHDHSAAASHDDAAIGSLDQAGGSHEHHAKAINSGHAGKCSTCASCCSAAAMSTAVISVEVTPQHSPAVATIPMGNAVETIGGLDRPPRLLLA